MGPTAGSSGLALIIGISEGTLGGLVGVQAFFAAADHVAVWGARVKSMKLFGYPHFPSYDVKCMRAICSFVRSPARPYYKNKIKKLFLEMTPPLT